MPFSYQNIKSEIRSLYFRSEDTALQSRINFSNYLLSMIFFFTSSIGGYSIPNLEFLALANLELWPAGKKKSRNKFFPQWS